MNVLVAATDLWWLSNASWQGQANYQENTQEYTYFFPAISIAVAVDIVLLHNLCLQDAIL